MNGVYFKSQHQESLQQFYLHLKIRIMRHTIILRSLYIYFFPPLHGVWSYYFQDFFVHSFIVFNLVTEVDSTRVAQKQGVSRKYKQGQNILISILFSSQLKVSGIIHLFSLSEIDHNVKEGIDSRVYKDCILCFAIFWWNKIGSGRYISSQTFHCFLVLRSKNFNSHGRKLDK